MSYYSIIIHIIIILSYYYYSHHRNEIERETGLRRRRVYNIMHLTHSHFLCNLL